MSHRHNDSDEARSAQSREDRCLDGETADCLPLSAAETSTAALHFDSTIEIPTNPSGEKVGPYRLRSRIGEGGMGSVWLAEQHEPVKRLVALKLIKPGMASGGVLQRFESERRALALMDHPNIAKILDAGTSTDGRPWFAMEHVVGDPLSRYCDSLQLSLRARLEMFCDICAGVQHAHQKGIIHRDLKPSNIVVTTVDGHPVPKVIDFGLAKAIDPGHGLASDASLTGFGQILGTLRYMSPEQASLGVQDIDTRTDVYALGVILFELLVGRTPIDASLAQNEPLPKVLERIRDDDVQRPSTQFKSLCDSDASIILKHRSSTAPALMRLLQGDLDWIVLKSVEKDRSRRYQSAAELQRDVLRYLDDEPVEARPPSKAYLTRKFVRKNRVLVIAASLVAAALAFGLLGTTWSLFVANRRAEGEHLANVQSQQRLQKIEQSNEILSRIFQDLNIDEVKSEGKALEQVLADRLVTAGQQISDGSIGDPLVESMLQFRLGESLLNLGRFEAALNLFTQVKAVRERELELGHADTLAAMNGVGEALLSLGRLQEAHLVFQSTLDLCQKYLHGSHEMRLTSLNNYAESLRAQGNFAESIPYFREVLELRKQELGATNRKTIVSMSNLALALDSSEQTTEALDLYRQVFDLATSYLGADHPTTLVTANNLAIALRENGKAEEGLNVYQKAYGGWTLKRGIQHPLSLRMAVNIADCMRSLKHNDRAKELLIETTSRMRLALGPAHPETLAATNDLAALLCEMNDFDDAVSLYQAVLNTQDSVDKGISNDLLNVQLSSISGLAFAYWKSGLPGQALPLYEQLRQQQTQLHGPTAFETLSVVTDMGVVYRDAGQLDKSIECLEQVVANISVHPRLYRSRQELRTSYVRAGRLDEVAEMLGEDLVQIRRDYKPGSLELAAQLALIASHYLAIEQFDPAEKMARECWEIRNASIPDDWRAYNVQSMLGEAILGKIASVHPGDLMPASSVQCEEALGEAHFHLTKAYEGLRKHEELMPKNTRVTRLTEAIERLIRYYEFVDNKAEIVRWQQELSIVDGP